MKRSKTALSVIALSIILPSSAILPRQEAFANTNNIQVNSDLAPSEALRDRVRVTTHNGNINVSTEKTAVSVPYNRPRTQYFGRYWRIPWRNNCQNFARQTTQLSSSGKKIVQHSSSNYCR